MTDGRDRSDALIVTVSACYPAADRRYVFEPLSDGPADAEFLRVEEVHGAAGWRTVGEEPVQDVQIDRPEADDAA